MTDKKVGRKPLKEADVVDINFDDEATAAASKATAELAIQASEALDKLGYEGVYDKESVISKIKFHMDQGAVAMFEMGRHLLVMKEMEPHGEFVSAVKDRLGLTTRTAQMMMKATTKFLMNPSLNSKTKTFSFLGASKLYELMSESDEDLNELIDGGTLAGVTLDEIDTMSVRELKDKLKERDEEIENQSRLIDQKNKQIDKLEMKQSKSKNQPSDEVLKDLQQEFTTIYTDIQGRIHGALGNAVKEIIDHAQEHKVDCTDFLAGGLGAVQRAAMTVRDEFFLPDHVKDGKPEWVKNAIEAGEMDEDGNLIPTDEE